MHASLDGLLLNYRHFYASYDYAGTDSRWYPSEVRVVRPGREIFSWGDAQGFRKGNRLKLNVLQTEAWMKQNVPIAEAYDYHLRPSSLARFTGTHPDVMSARIARINWTFNADPSYHHLSLKDRFKQFALRYLGWDLNHRNFRRIH